jgi:hypothetical protein
MDSDKTVRATFVEDTSDPDEDGLSNYQEIIVHLSNPNLADTDGDGVEDGQEVTDGTGPRLVDSDADDLSDGEEKTFGHRSPAWRHRQRRLRRWLRRSGSRATRSWPVPSRPFS